ncbi:hypothetical protein B0H14DRAFT_2984336, partial [Mycena olivaceomarginata]
MPTNSCTTSAEDSALPPIRAWWTWRARARIKISRVSLSQFLIAVLFARNHIVLPSWTFSSQHTARASILLSFPAAKNCLKYVSPAEFTFRQTSVPLCDSRATSPAHLDPYCACSVVDLLVAVQDVVTSKHLQGPISNGARLYLVLKKMFLEHQILHKHIEGVVIDLDFPDLIEASRSTEEFGLCGTLAFQSLKRLGSLRFYVLCWACYGYSHDGRPDKFRPNWMGRWTERHSVESIYSEKTLLFRSSEIPSHVNRYMGCQRDILESVIEKIRRKIERQLPNDPEA